MGYNLYKVIGNARRLAFCGREPGDGERGRMGGLALLALVPVLWYAE